MYQDRNEDVSEIAHHDWAAGRPPIRHATLLDLSGDVRVPIQGLRP